MTEEKLQYFENRWYYHYITIAESWFIHPSKGICKLEAKGVCSLHVQPVNEQDCNIVS